MTFLTFDRHLIGNLPVSRAEFSVDRSSEVAVWGLRCSSAFPFHPSPFKDLLRHEGNGSPTLSHEPNEWGGTGLETYAIFPFSYMSTTTSEVYCMAVC